MQKAERLLNVSWGSIRVEIRYKTLKKIRKKLSVLILAIAPVLLGCADAEVAKVRALVPAASFSFKQLHLQYGAMALRKDAEGNIPAARHFSAKAARAAHGLPVAPDEPGNDFRDDAYQRLVAALDHADRFDDPAVLVRAQVMFDCWLDEQTQGVDPDDAVACRREFERALLLISSANAAARQGGMQ
jgi:hypothetical protein